MLVLSNEEIEKLITMKECMAALEEMYRDVAEARVLTMPRVDNIVPCSHEEAYYAFKHMGGIWPRRHIMALRINSDVITHPTVGNSARRVKVPLANGRWVGLVELFDTETGELIAMFPDGVTQRMRVGAANGLAMRYLAREDARRAGLIGSGWQAGAQLLALLAVRPIEEVKVYSLTPEHCHAFAEEARRSTGVNIRAVDSAAECVRDVDILLTATSSMVPIVKPEWLCEGMHLGCVKVQEVDGPVLDRCDRLVVHNKQQTSQIDNILPGTPHLSSANQEGWWKEGSARWDRIDQLSDLIAGRRPGRASAKEINGFINNVGLGLQFAAVGSLILDQARKQGVGQELPREWFSEAVHP
ncbi:MAG: ornithine cyclodeaminase family protein [Chloroflexi bacterium]|nr:ornithine cyclodeaminase family protein [Chloroflexota bacterium]